MAFIRDGTKLMTSARPLIIQDTADLIVKHRDGGELIPRGMKDGWLIGQDNKLGLIRTQGKSMPPASV